MSHGDRVTQLPPGFKVVGVSKGAPFAAIADEKRKLYAVQFHPEVTHTRQGRAIYTRFVHEICGVGPSWNMPQFVPQSLQKIRDQVGKDEVILGLSGGVDSSYSLTRNTISHPLNEDTITQLVTIHGFDIRLGDDKAHVFEQKLRNTRMLGARLGKGVISITNNLQDLTEKLQIQWGSLAHGAALASVGLLMANRFRKFYIAPNWSYARILPSGAHPLLDPLWSTESLTFFHDGCEASRLGRIRLIAQHPVT
jgi:hypothetical protein